MREPGSDLVRKVVYQAELRGRNAEKSANVGGPCLVRKSQTTEYAVENGTKQFFTFFAEVLRDQSRVVKCRC